MFVVLLHCKYVQICTDSSCTIRFIVVVAVASAADSASLQTYAKKEKKNRENKKRLNDANKHVQWIWTTVTNAHTHTQFIQLNEAN